MEREGRVRVRDWFSNARNKTKLFQELIPYSTYFFLIFSSEIDSHKVTVYKGPTSTHPILKTITGFAAKQKVMSNGVDQVLVEFR